MKKITEEWLKAAKDDLDVIERIIPDEHLSNIVAFHSQQCVEKSFKAVIEEFDLGVFRIHNLDRLFEIIKHHIRIDADVLLIEQLDKLYTDARYPGDLGLLPYGKPMREDAENFYEFAKSVYKTVTSDLGK